MPIINQVVAGSGGSSVAEPYLEFSIDANGVLQHSKTTSRVIDLTGVKDVLEYALYFAYYNNTAISGAIDMSDLETITGSSACTRMYQGCTGVTGADLSSLTTVSGSAACRCMFLNCTNLTNINISSLERSTSQSGCDSMFSGCTSLTTANISSLTRASNTNACQAMFAGCSSLTSADISSLVVVTETACRSMFKDCTALSSINPLSMKTIQGNNACVTMFSGCSALTSLSFPAITTTTFGSKTNQFTNLCQNIPSITLHFPSNVQSIIEGLTGYSTTAPFGAVSGTVLFDLPKTVILTGANTVEYERNPKYDTATALAWRTKDTDTVINPTIDFTPYYTSGTTDPSVGDTIYSDAACTQSVTTITAIA